MLSQLSPYHELTKALADTFVDLDDGGVPALNGVHAAFLPIFRRQVAFEHPHDARLAATPVTEHADRDRLHLRIHDSSSNHVRVDVEAQ